MSDRVSEQNAKHHCSICRWKYSCGYSSIRRGKEDDDCPLGQRSNNQPFFKKKTNTNKVWSFQQQKLVPEIIARKESGLGKNPNDKESS